MSKRRQPNERVRRKPGSCCLGAAQPEIVRLSGPEDGELHECDHLQLFCCMLDCDDPECVEWANVQIVGGPHDGEWLFHLSECQMEDV
jgi:hypothetical protein